MKFPEMDRNSFLASPSSGDESRESSENPSDSPRRVSCSSPRSGWSRIQVDIQNLISSRNFDCSICDREEKMFHQFWEREFEKVLFRTRLGNSSKLGMHICKSRNILFLSVQDVKLAGKKQNIDPMWKVLKKVVDLDEPTSFLDHVYGLHSTGMRRQQRY